MEKKIYAYEHINPATGKVFYVGVGSISRTRNYKVRSKRYLDYVKANDINPVTRIVGCFNTEIEADKLERELISKYGLIKNGGQLVNWQSFSKVWTDDSREKMSATAKGKYTGTNNPYFGRHHGEDIKAKISKVHKGKTISDEHKAILSERFKGGNHNLAKRVLNLATNEIYSCAKDAAKAFGVAHSTMRSMLNGSKKNKTTAKYIS